MSFPSMWAEVTIHDLRLAGRRLRRSPGFGAAAVLTFAVGIGVTTAMFTVVSAVLLRPLPYAQSDRLVIIRERIPKLGPEPIPVDGRDIARFQKETRSFEDVAGFKEVQMEASGGDAPERLTATRMAWNAFPLLGTAPAMGRTFAAAEDHPGSLVAVLSHAAWQRRFSGALDVLDRTVRLDRKAYTIIGVMPSGFVFPLRGASARRSELWVPLGLTEVEARGEHFAFGVVARLKPGVTIAQANADLEVEAKRIQQGFALPDIQLGALALPFREQAFGDVKRPLLLLLAAVAALLLIAIANVAGLLLARGAARRTEIAVRLALGAGGPRLFSQLIAESALLAMAGGLVAIGAAAWGTRALVDMAPSNLEPLQAVELDWRVLSFGLALCALTGAASALAPAVLALRADVNRGLKDAGPGATLERGHGRLRSAFIVGQVALAVVLLVGAGLLIRSFERVMSGSPGFRAEEVVTAEMSLPKEQYRTGEAMKGFYANLTRALGHLPGVKSAGASSDLPLEGQWTVVFSVEGYEPPAGAGFNVGVNSVVLGDYFEALGIPLLRGRRFHEADDDPKAPVAIISQSIAERYFPDADALGRRIKWGLPESNTPWMTIVGVTGDVTQGRLDATTLPHIYEPLLQMDPLLFTLTETVSTLHLAVRADDPATAVAGLRSAVWSIDRELPVTRVRTMEQVVSESTGPRRFNTMLVTVFAAAALLLAGVGLYGVIAHGVAQRTRELGVRMALGARASDIFGLVMRGGAVLTVAGLGIGIVLALAVARVLSGFLYGIGPADPFTFAAVAALLMAVAAVASFVPALRAVRVNPLVTLRHE